MEYCQEPYAVPVWAVMATPTERSGAARKAPPKTAATVSPAGLGVGFAVVEKPSTGVKAALAPVIQEGACLTKLTAIDALAPIVLKRRRASLTCQREHRVGGAGGFVPGQCTTPEMRRFGCWLGRLLAGWKRTCATPGRRNAAASDIVWQGRPDGAVEPLPVSRSRVVDDGDAGRDRLAVGVGAEPRPLEQRRRAVTAGLLAFSFTAGSGTFAGRQRRLALLKELTAIRVVALKGVTPPVPVVFRLTVVEKLPVPSQA